MSPMALGVLLLTALPPCPEPPARYYLLLFGGQREFLAPQTAHGWAAYVRVQPQPDGSMHLESLTISWLPETLRVRVLALRPEVGRNFTLEETFAFMAGPRERNFLWGPYEIDAHRYAEAVARKAWLDSGTARYRVNNWFGLAESSPHCLRAVDETHPEVAPRWRITPCYGQWGMAHYAAALVEKGIARKPCADAEWLLPALRVPPTILRRSVR